MLINYIYYNINLSNIYVTNLKIKEYSWNCIQKKKKKKKKKKIINNTNNIKINI